MWHERTLTDHEVLQIVEMIQNSVRQTEIAEQFGVSQSLISQIKGGKKFEYITGGKVEVINKRPSRAKPAPPRKKDEPGWAERDSARRSEWASNFWTGKPKTEIQKQRMSESKIKLWKVQKHPKFGVPATERQKQAVREAKHKLTDEQVIEILNLHKDKMPGTDIAEIYGVSLNTIYNILHGMTYKHIPRD